MTDTPADDPTDASTDASEGVEPTLDTSTAGYKILGELLDASGIGVLGRNTAGSGTPVGVRGEVPNATGGFGLATPDDVRIGGAIDTGGTDFAVEAGTTATSDAANVVVGHVSNRATSGVVGAVVGGGGYDDGSTFLPNQANDDYGTIGGGRDNRVGASGDSVSVFATVGGGEGNTASGDRATVGGGEDNTASGEDATVSGGDGNTASGRNGTVGGGRSNDATNLSATVAGGADNEASGLYGSVAGGEGNDATETRAHVGGGGFNDATGRGATVPGGVRNKAEGSYSFAAGREATAGHDGAFVLGDSSTTAISSSGPDEIRSQMPIYAPAHNTTSARSEKTAIRPVDPSEVLAGVRSLAVSTWEFVHTDDGRHMGPMAGDFHEAFGLGDDDDHIAGVDADGVAMAAIQALSRELDEKNDRIDDLAAETEDLRAENGQLRERLRALADRVASLEAERDAPAPVEE